MDDDILKCDDNAMIHELIMSRLQLGLKTYGHGVRIDDPDIESYGVKENDWNAMTEEEVMDGLIYSAAAILRNRRLNHRRVKHVRRLIAEKNKLSAALKHAMARCMMLDCRCEEPEYSEDGKTKIRETCDSCKKYNEKHYPQMFDLEMTDEEVEEWLNRHPNTWSGLDDDTAGDSEE